MTDCRSRRLSLRAVVALLLVLTAVVPTAVVSVLTLKRLPEVSGRLVALKFDSDIAGAQRELEARYAIGAANFRRLSSDPHLYFGLSNPMLQANSARALAEFVEETVAVDGAYLIARDWRLFEAAGGREWEVEDEPVLRAIRERSVQHREASLLILNRSGSPLLLLVEPVFPPGLNNPLAVDPAGILVARLSWEALQAAVAAAVPAGERFELALGDSGTLPPAAGDAAGLDRRTRVRLASDVVAGVLPLDLSWYANAEQRLAESESLAVQLRGGIAAVALLALILLLFASTLIRRPFEALYRQLDRFAAGDYRAVERGSPYREFAHVEDVLSTMGGTINRQLKALREAKYTLEAKVAEQTRELRAALSTAERSGALFRRMALLGIRFSETRGYPALIDAAASELQDLYPAQDVAVLVAGSDESPPVLAGPRVDVALLEGLYDAIAGQLGERRAREHERIQVRGQGWLLLPVTGSADTVLGGIALHGVEESESPDPALMVIARQLGSEIENRRLNDRIAAQAVRDELTGLGNRHAFEEALDRAGLEFARHPERRFAVFIIDANGLKPINDSFGHPVGDAALRALGVSLAEVVRGGDRLYRIGGDEFAVIASVADPAECELIAARLTRVRAAPSVEAMTSCGTACVLTVSAGWATAGETPVERLYQTADAMMYANKRHHYRERSGQQAGGQEGSMQRGDTATRRGTFHREPGTSGD